MLHIILNYVSSNIKMLPKKKKDTDLNKFSVYIKQDLIKKKKTIQIFNTAEI